MLKLVVYDLGWGGELVADFLTHELQTVEVDRAISWHLRSGSEKPLPPEDIQADAVEVLRPYFDKVDLVVLGGYTVAAVFDFLCQNFPEQKFVRLDIDCRPVLQSRNYPRQIAILMSRNNIESEACLALRENLANSTLFVPDCADWEYLIDENQMTFEEIYRTFAPDFTLHVDLAKRRPLANVLQSGTELQVRPEPRNQYRLDAVILLSSHFWAIKAELEQIFGYGVRIIDFRNKLLHDVCRALKLRGVDGRNRY